MFHASSIQRFLAKGRLSFTTIVAVAGPESAQILALRLRFLVQKHQFVSTSVSGYGKHSPEIRAASCALKNGHYNVTTIGYPASWPVDNQLSW